MTEHFKHKIHDDLVQFYGHKVEAILVELHCNVLPRLIVGETYHLPGKSTYLFLENLVPCLSAEGTVTYLMGNLNVSLMSLPQSRHALELIFSSCMLSCCW